MPAHAPLPRYPNALVSPHLSRHALDRYLRRGVLSGLPTWYGVLLALAITALLFIPVGIVMAITFLAGFMLDPLVIILIVVPITAPLIVSAGFDVVWFCVVFLVMLQTAYLTPPMAPSIFYLRGIAPPEITLRHMYVGIWPFIGLQVLVLSTIIAFPRFVTWLPNLMIGR
ncbi:TRAP transporter large permease subunit [bacterium]|nr:TRAP transporter large permease subunit [bacterium]